MNNRQNDILKRITEQKEATVSELAKNFGVSEVTVRKDLNYLEENGLIRREHGYARININDDIRLRLANNYDIKQKIAKRAAEFVDEDEFVLIESGSCCALLAMELAKTKPSVTIVTNSAFIADFVHKEPVNVILLGGDYQNTAQVTVGPLMTKNLQNFNVQKAFVGIDGYKDGLFTGNDYMRSQAVLDFTRQANKTFVLSDSSKFGTCSRFNHLRNSDVAVLITDEGVPEKERSEFEAVGVQVEIVK